MASSKDSEVTVPAGAYWGRLSPEQEWLSIPSLLNQCVGHFPSCCDETHDKLHLEENLEFSLAHSLGVQPIVTGEAWLEELEAADDVASTVRMQSEEMCVGGVPTSYFSSCLVQDPSPWSGATHLS